MSHETQPSDLTLPYRAAAGPLAAERPARTSLDVAEEQLTYAALLGLGMKAGLLSLIASFAIYASGLLAPLVPFDELPRVWSLPVREYLAATGVHTGWSWVRLLDRGDFLNFLGIAFLSGVTIVCYLAIIPIFFRQRDRIYAWISIVEVLVLTLAASGLLAVGGH
jgi:hypothetical protein